MKSLIGIPICNLNRRAGEVWVWVEVTYSFYIGVCFEAHNGKHKLLYLEPL